MFDTLAESRKLRGRDALGGHSPAAVCEREFETRLDKTCQRSNWARRPLAEEQIRYAALDAELLPGLWSRFQKRQAERSMAPPETSPEP